VRSCQICSGGKLRVIISLGHQPPSDEFLSEEMKDIPYKVYPLDLLFCESCNLVQLGYSVDPSVLFREYAYNTGSSAELKKQFSELTSSLAKKYNLSGNDFAVDIGSNDGTLLEGFKSLEIKVLGIDPSSATSLAKQKGIPTLVEFFDESSANRVIKEHGLAKIITATNVLAHVDKLSSFMKGISLMLAKDGVFISESHHLLNMVTKMQYDQIYHEHLRYYSLKPLMQLFNNYDLDVISVEEVSTHGGSIRVYAAHKGAYPVEKSVLVLLEKEERAGLYDYRTYQTFAGRIVDSKHELLELLLRLKKDGNTVVGIGAPAKGNTLLNYCQIHADLIPYLAEHSSLKIGKFAPGSLIPVVSENRVFEEQPEYGLVLSWNLKDFIIPKLRNKGYNGKFIIPGEKLTLE
jgi:hypothetical protein